MAAERPLKGTRIALSMSESTDIQRFGFDQCSQHWWDYPDMVQLLRDTGPGGINPLLSENQNRELFRTRNVGRMIELILNGLNNLNVVVDSPKVTA